MMIDNKKILLSNINDGITDYSNIEDFGRLLWYNKERQLYFKGSGGDKNGKIPRKAK